MLKLMTEKESLHHHHQDPSEAASRAQGVFRNGSSSPHPDMLISKPSSNWAALGSLGQWLNLAKCQALPLG